LPQTVVRPASFMVWLQAARQEAAAHGVIRGPLPADQVRNYVAPEDIGRLVAEFFEAPTVWLGETIELAGDAVSYAEAAELLSRHVGRPVRYAQIPWSEYVQAASATEIARDEWYLEHDVATDVGPLRARFPWLTSVDQYLAALPAMP
jgi:uncharacterized protein YbjT (DUF2867 family)